MVLIEVGEDGGDGEDGEDGQSYRNPQAKLVKRSPQASFPKRKGRNDIANEQFPSGAFQVEDLMHHD